MSNHRKSEFIVTVEAILTLTEHGQVCPKRQINTPKGQIGRFCEETEGGLDVISIFQQIVKWNKYKRRKRASP